MPISSNILCKLTLSAEQRNELLAAFSERRKQSPYPSMAIQIFAHNVREHSQVDVYIGHAAELIDFSSQTSLQWLETQIVEAYRRFRKAATS